MAKKAGSTDKEVAQPVFAGLSSENLAGYAGQWVAFVDGTILAHGKHLRDVYDRAMKKARTKTPTFYPVPSQVAGY